MRSESELHQQFEAWLRKRGIPFITSRMDKRSTIGDGMPDYCVAFMGRCCFVECKIGKAKLSEKQERAKAFIERAGCRVTVARTIEQCIEAANSILCDHGQPGALKQEEGITAAPETPLPQQNGSPSGQAEPPFRIANWAGTQYVMSPKLGGGYAMIRQATPEDVSRFPKVA